MADDIELSPPQRSLQNYLDIELRETAWAERFAELHDQEQNAQTEGEKQRIAREIDAHLDARDGCVSEPAASDDGGPQFIAAAGHDITGKLRERLGDEPVTMDTFFAAARAANRLPNQNFLAASSDENYCDANYRLAEEAFAKWIVDDDMAGAIEATKHCSAMGAARMLAAIRIAKLAELLGDTNALEHALLERRGDAVLPYAWRYFVPRLRRRVWEQRRRNNPNNPAAAGPQPTEEKGPIMEHRHLNHREYTLAAVDSVISRGRTDDWVELAAALRADVDLRKRVIAFIKQRLTDPDAIHSDYYHWLFAAEDMRSSLTRKDMRRLWPSAIEVGAGPLYGAHWITNTPLLIELAIDQNETAPAQGRVVLHRRPATWYEIIRPGITQRDPLPSLLPPYALADALLDGFFDGKMWCPTPYDIDYASAQDVSQFTTALALIESNCNLCMADRLPPPGSTADMKVVYEQAWEAVRANAD